MASTVNVSTVLTSNTFDQWRIQTNLLKDDVNEVARGDFVKPTGNVTFTIGRLVLANSTGTMLDVTADGRISGKLSVKNIEQDGGAAYFYSDSGDIQFRADGNFIANGNTRTRYLYNNNFFSAANINANGFIQTTGTFANGNLIMNVAGILMVGNTTAGGNVNVSSNVTISQNVTAANATIGTKAVITLANITTLNVNTAGAVANLRNVSIQNSVTTNSVTDIITITTRANAVLANIVTLNVATLNANAVGAVANLRNVSIQNSTTTNAVVDVISVTTRANIQLANIINANIGNIGVTDLTIATANVTTRINAASANIATLWVGSLTTQNPISAPAESAAESYRLRVNVGGDGYFGVGLGTASANGNSRLEWIQTDRVWKATANDISIPSSTLLTVANVKTAYGTDTANVATLNLVKVTNDNAVAALVQANSAANTVRVMANSASILPSKQLNFVNTATIFVNVAAHGGDASNANISFTVNNADPSLLGPQGVQGVQGAQGRQGTTGAQGVQGLQGLRGTDGIIGVDGAQGSIGIQGPQGTNGAQGTQGLQGLQGLQGRQGTTGANGTNGDPGIQGQIGIQGPQGTNGAQGTQGLQGLQGRQGVQGSTGANGTNGDPGIQGSQGTNGVQGQIGQNGAQGAQGTIGAQGVQGLIGIQGVQGRQGVQGPNGPSTNINASADSSTATLYPVMVTGTGGAAPKIHTTQLIFNASTGVLSAYDFATTSDARLKSVMHPIYDAVFKLEQISGVVYNWNDYAKAQFGYHDDIQVGVLAQDVLKVLPEAVHEENCFLRVSYDRLVPLLIEAIKELSERVKTLEGK